MIQTPTQSLTLEEFLKLPETKPASEYIDGEILQKPMPSAQHSIIQGDLCGAIHTTLKPNGYALLELLCIFDGRAIVPDIAVFVRDRMPRNPNGRVADLFALAPDWIVEVFSPEQSITKLIRKFLHCFQHGTQMAWLVDPEEEIVLVFCPQQQPQFFDEAEQQLPVPEFAAAFQLTVGELFGFLDMN